jgi:hypothetical protein
MDTRVDDTNTFAADNFDGSDATGWTAGPRAGLPTGKTPPR